MKNVWIEKSKIRQENDYVLDMNLILGDDYVLDMNLILGDTFKEKFEGVYALISDIYKKQGGTKIEASPESGCLFDTCCAGFSPLDPSEINSGQSYRVSGGPARGFNMWIVPTMRDPIYRIHVAEDKIITVYLDNLIV